jgi:hypothetical protein
MVLWNVAWTRAGEVHGRFEVNRDDWKIGKIKDVLSVFIVRKKMWKQLGKFGPTLMEGVASMMWKGGIIGTLVSQVSEKLPYKVKM